MNEDAVASALVAMPGGVPTRFLPLCHTKARLSPETRLFAPVHTKHAGGLLRQARDRHRENRGLSDRWDDGGRNSPRLDVDDLCIATNNPDERVKENTTAAAAQQPGFVVANSLAFVPSPSWQMTHRISPDKIARVFNSLMKRCVLA